MNHEPKIDEVITAYLKAVETGYPVDDSEWLQRYPDLAEELVEFFASQRSVERVAAPFREKAQTPLRPDDHPTVGPTGATQASNLLGTVRYFGDYELIEEIARGGMGVVFKARQAKLQRNVAIKMILAGELANSIDVERFYTEARAAAGLHHPNIVAIHEVGQYQGQHYFSMDYVAGESLAERIARGPLPVREAAALLQTVAQAVAFAHVEGVIHRDLKPANILLDQKGEPHVTDFGLAKRVGNGPSAMGSNAGTLAAAECPPPADLTATGQVLGTPSYMPPEQAAGKTKELGPRCDVYSLGAVLYCALTGRPPFQAASTLDTLLQVLDQDPVPPRQLQPKVPRSLETICLKCLHKEPSQRYDSAADLAEDLRRFLADEPILARPVGGIERTVKWVKRRPVVTALLAAVTLVTVTGVGGISWALGLAVEQRDKYRDEKTKAERQLLRAEWLVYAGQIALAQQAWESSNVPLAYHYFDACRSDFRGWEHDYLSTLFNSNQQTLRGHTNEVLCVAQSADGQRLVSGSSDNTVKVWDALTGRVLQTFVGHTAGVKSVALSADGQRIVSGSFDKTIKVWDVNTGHTLLTLNGPEITSVTFSADGQRIFSTGLFNTSVAVWDATTGQKLQALAGHTHFVMSVAVSHDGKQLVSGSYDKTVKLWDAATGKNIKTFQGHTAEVNCVALSADGRRIVSGGQDDTAIVWHASTGKAIATLKGHAGPITGVALSADGKRLVTGSVDRTIKIWDVDTGQETFTFKGHTGWVSDVALSLDGTRIVSGSRDGTLKLWDPTQSQQTKTYKGHTAGVLSAVVSADGKHIVTGSWDQTVKVWNIATGESRTFQGHTGHVSSVALSVDGKHIISGSSDRSVKMWDVAAGRADRTFEGHTSIVTGVALSRDGKRIVSCSSDHTIKIWDIASGKEIATLRGHGDRVHSVALSSDGNRIVSGSNDRTVVIWDTTTLAKIHTLQGHSDGIAHIVLSADGKRVASASADKTVKIWDLETGDEIVTLKGHTAGINGVAFSPDGKRIISGSSDKTVKVWAMDAGQETLTLHEHKNFVNTVASSTDGTFIVSGSEDGIVKVWDASRKTP